MFEFHNFLQWNINIFIGLILYLESVFFIAVKRRFLISPGSGKFDLQGIFYQNSMAKAFDKKFCWEIKNFSSLNSERCYSVPVLIGDCKW